MDDRKNFFHDIPDVLPEELIENVFQSEQVRIERIVSNGQSSPSGFWYDQSEGEWVILLRGGATLEFKDPPRMQSLSSGDYVYIPPHRKHRVFSTSEKQTTIWLAVFLKRPKHQWKIRKAILDDVPVLKSLYRDTIENVCAGDYDPEQIQAWSSNMERTGSMAKKIESQHFFVAKSDEEDIIGFASFEEPDYLDMMYVHKDFQYQGVGDSLMRVIREKASELGTSKIISDVSITAKPFFGKHGFRVLKKQTVRIGDIELNNYKMELILHESKQK